MKKLPVIFLAFANNRLNQGRYLPDLAEEERALRAILQDAGANGLCEVVSLGIAGVEDILGTFTHKLYRDRIAIFHFAGHANSFHLLMEGAGGRPELAHAEGLADFLGQQKGLKLVFLNGCATLAQAERLLENNVQHVIAASSPIDDRQATDFSRRFYRSLAAGAGIGRAFREARAAEAVLSGKAREDMPLSGEQPAEGFAWKLLTRPGSEASETWSLPEAVNNPLFGLPAPAPGPLPGNPFPNLHWFTEEHAEVFFGRGYEIRRLYACITDPTAAPVIVLYGQSGAGKSSLLAAGLLPRLRQEQEVRYERRSQEGGLAKSFERVFNSAVPKVIARLWSQKEAGSSKPFTLILDQVEELFTRPHGGEESLLVSTLKNRFGKESNRPEGKAVLALRKEYLAELEALLQSHQVFYTKVFVKSLSRPCIIEAVSGIHNNPKLQAHYGLNIPPDLPEIIAHDLAEGAGPASIAPTLQVLLHKLWEEAKQADPDEPVFSLELYRRLKAEGLLLDDFLGRQLEKLPQAFRESGLALDLLKFHVTDLDTARQRAQAETQEAYSHIPDEIEELLQRLKDAYLLLDIRGGTRLAHDTLAPLASRRYHESEAPGQRAARILESRELGRRPRAEWPLLSKKDLELAEAGEKGKRRQTPLEQALIDDSRKAIKRKRSILRVAASLFGLVFLALAIVVGFWKAEQQLARNISQKFRAASEAMVAVNLAHQDPDALWDAYRIAKGAYERDSNLQTVNALIEMRQQAPVKLEGVEWPEGLSKAIGEGLFMEKDSLDAGFLIRWPYELPWGKVHFPPGYGTNQLDEAPIIDISGDGSYALAVLPGEKKGFVWRLGQRQPVCELDLGARPKAARFSEDGAVIFVSDALGRANAWALWQKTEFSHGSPVASVAAGPAAFALATGGEDGRIRLWAKDGRLLQTLDGQQGAINQMSFLDGNGQLIVASDNEVRVWDVEGDSQQAGGFTNGNFVVARPAQGQVSANWVMIVERYGLASVYSFEQPGTVAEFGEGRKSLVNAALYQGRKNLVVTVHDVGELKLWDWHSRAVVDSMAFTERINSVEFSPDGREILVSCSDSSAYIIPLAGNGRRFAAGSIELLHARAVNTTHYSRDGRWIVTASSDHTAKVWARNGEWLKTFAFDNILVEAVFSWDGQEIIACGDKGRCRAVLIHPAEIIRQFEQAYQAVKN